MKKEYNIHNIVKVLLDASGPIAKSVDLHLSYFRCNFKENESPDIIFSDNIAKLSSSSYFIGSKQHLYDGKTILLRDSNLSIQINKKGQIIVFSPRGINPSPFIHLQLLKKGFTFIHAAAVNYNSQGIIFPAWGGTGKTSLSAVILDKKKTKFLGDDFVIISKTGKIYSFPQPFSLYYYHASLFSDTFKHKKKILVGPKGLELIKCLRHIAKPLLLKFPKAEDIAKRFSPDYMAVPVEHVIAKNKISDQVDLKKIIFLTKYSGNNISIEICNKEEIIKKIVGILHYEFEEALFLKWFTVLSSFGIIDLADCFLNMKKILNSGLDKLEYFQVMIPDKSTPKEIYIQLKKEKIL